MPKIVISIPMRSDVLRRIEALPDATVIVTDHVETAGTSLPTNIIADAAVLVCKLPPANHAAMRVLKLVQLSSVGFTQLAPLQLSARGIRACNARGVYDTAIAEWTLAMMINLARDVRGMIRHQDQGIWDRAERFCGEIRSRTVGIWGYGGIGRETARLGKMLGLTVHVMVRRIPGRRDDSYVVAGTGDSDGSLPDLVFSSGEELEFLRSIDFLVLAMPLNAANTGLVGERELKAMKPSAFLLNPARGPLVQENVLLKALNENWIAGAALDTHFSYPMPPDHPLWRMPNVIMTPHISGSDKGTHFLDRMGEIVEHNVANFLAGQPLWNEIPADDLK